MIATEKLRQGIEANSEVELKIDELLASAMFFQEDFIKVNNKEVTMIFNKEYECVECYGEVITVEIDSNECEEVR
ncbi:hypothetical protein [Methanobrevibacter arboriphilus]|uniref:hypothetical protein n=1 Tax=Methanobrevibacter arboriphilus TaxID=39441 RepID=UPI0005B27830|nr:hypothetical protein [Methanobrevibacter arboriphilus]